jgi:hypothetical protein
VLARNFSGLEATDFEGYEKSALKTMDVISWEVA